MVNNQQLSCHSDQRHHQVRRKAYNGLDYLEIVGEKTLKLYFLGPAPTDLKPENIHISGGRRITDLYIERLKRCTQDDPALDECILLILNKRGDFSTYTLCLVALDDQGRQTDQPLPGFDPRYTCLDFSFKVDCPSDLDCKEEDVCPPETFPEPEINYLAKDYASFRQLILDRLALTIPLWQERHVPDVGIALVELLAYAGDYLSYYQDAVATEAYLDTARQRISVRRHARLVDYLMHEGCNARAWVQLNTNNEVKLEPDEIALITKVPDLPAVDDRLLTWEDLVENSILPHHYEVFEPLLPQTAFYVYPAHNCIEIYTWGDEECCLLRGATSATLKDGRGIVPAETDDPQQRNAVKQNDGQPGVIYERSLHLKPGDLLLFEEVMGPKTGFKADKNLTHRHVVRLTKVEAIIDYLYDQPVLEVHWAEEDALPFPLCVSVVGPAPDCDLLENISVARGNVILVDHGRRIEAEDLGEVPLKTTEIECEGKDRPSEISKIAGPFRPTLEKAPLTYAQPLPDHGPAAGLLTQDPRAALPWIELTNLDKANPDFTTVWHPRWDLLDSRPSDRHFVVEIDDNRRPYLRFGQEGLGQMSEAATSFSATYRIGNGAAGNVGAGTIVHLISQITFSGVTITCANPLPAGGGIDPEPIENVKLFAPYAFRRELQRAITAQDYADLVMREFETKVQRAAAVLRWTGSWYEVLVVVDQKGQVTPDPQLLVDIKNCLSRYRRMGHDVIVRGAEYVPLLVELEICVLPHYLRGHVKAALQARFSSRVLSDGQLGYFHPDNLTFGEGIYLSDLVAVAQAIEGVESVIVNRLERYNEGDNCEIDDGVLKLGPLEVAQIDNDPTYPENGQFKLTMRGGR